MKTTVPTSFVLFRTPTFLLADLRQQLEQYRFNEPIAPQKETWGFDCYPGSADTLDVIGEYLRFGLRCDKRTVPPKLLKARVAERVAAWKVENPDRARVPKSVKDEITDAVSGELLRLTLPVPTVYPIVVHATDRWAVVGATATPVVDKARKLLHFVFGVAMEPITLLHMQGAGVGVVPESDGALHGGILQWLWYQSAHGIPITVRDETVGVSLDGPASVGGLRTGDADSLLPRCLLETRGDEVGAAPIRSLGVALLQGNSEGPYRIVLDGDGGGTFKGLRLPVVADKEASAEDAFLADMVQVEDLLLLLRGLAQAYHRVAAEPKGHAAYLRAWGKWATGEEAVGAGAIDKVTAAQIQEVVRIVQDPGGEKALALHERLVALNFDGLQGRLFAKPGEFERGAPERVERTEPREIAQALVKVLGTDGATKALAVAGRIRAVKDRLEALGDTVDAPFQGVEWSEALDEILKSVTRHGVSVESEARLSGIEDALAKWGDT